MNSEEVPGVSTRLECCQGAAIVYTSDGIVIRVVDHCLRAEIAEARGELTSIKDTGGWTPGMF